jgi:hypothetical protein
MSATALDTLTGRAGHSRRRLLILGSRLIAAVFSVGGQSQVEGLERHRPLQRITTATRRPTFSLEVGWLKGR